MIDSGLLALGAVAFVIFVIALVAVIRCDKSKMADVIAAFGQWWPWRRQ
jgi:hypothetical protein